ELLDWTRDSAFHMLIKSCVFHYELELIHPFADGNGRIGRLWHTLLLSQWNPLFAWLPVESIIHDRQEEYYAAINVSNAAGESTVFIEFMLSAIKTALLEAVGEAPSSVPKADLRWEAIRTFLQDHPVIMNADVRAILNVSSATANRILSGFVSGGRLQKVRVGSYWGYTFL
ncbi:MAG: Fic family protein, partial [Oscillibacter sp.]|nr:Fic family protein [Oscillibacter sp.]